jgi:uncharacterized protein (DUF2141 family)
VTALVELLLLGVLAHEPTEPTVVVTESEGEIQVEVSGFRSHDGHLLLVMFDQQAHFPGESAHAVHKDKKPAGSRVRFTIPNVTYGEYAITVVHDENDNGDLDKNWFGLPVEGFGTSNNAPSNVGPPRWNRAKFKVESATTHQSIKLKYFAPNWRPD